MKDLITVCIVNYNSSDFVLNSLYCLEKLTKNKYKVIIRDNNSNLRDYLNLEQKIIQFSNVLLYRVENFNYSGSVAHAIALNDLIKKIDTKYGVIMDADFTFLHKHWDGILIKELSEESPIIGTQPHINFGPYQKPLDFPHIFGILFHTKTLKQLQIDFKPDTFNKKEDTSFQIRKHYLHNGFKAKLILFKNSKNNVKKLKKNIATNGYNEKIILYNSFWKYKKGPFHKVTCAEYYLKEYKEIFASHFSRGSTVNRSKYSTGWKKFIYIIPFIGYYFLKSKVKRDKNKWIKICKKLANPSSKD